MVKLSIIKKRKEVVVMQKVSYEILKNSTVVATETSYQKTLEMCRENNYSYIVKVENIKEPIHCTEKQYNNRIKIK